MSVSANDFLTSAEVLLNNPNSTEMDFRNLISRSYYAAFHLSREIADTLPVPIEKSTYQRLGSHEKVIITFEKNSNQHLRTLGKLIRQYRNKRANADYDIHLHIKRAEAAQHFYAIKGLLIKLEALKHTEPRP
ncbi:MAG: hypothetical protein PHU14_04510 [Methylovulum sp.]|nr:hypothetical protein [Methylovulum sp.]